MSGKRQDYITWDNYFMGLAKLSAMRSKDPSSQVGCCIVNPENHRVLSLGYNGFPNGCSDDAFPWEKTSVVNHHTKYPYVVHSELNAILNAKTDLTGCVMYVTLSPCEECMKAIIQSGIKKVVYGKIYRADSDGYIASSRMASSAGIILEKYKNTDKEITFTV